MWRRRRLRSAAAVIALTLAPTAVLERAVPPASGVAAATVRKRVYCTAHHHPKHCVKVPKSAQRPAGISDQGRSPARQVDENAGGVGGGPRSPADRGHSVRWALTQLRSQDWYWRCELFVEQAYGTHTIYRSASAAADGIPLHHESIVKAPRGALVYFRSDASNHYRGHVGLSLGGGRMISALATVSTTDVAHSRYWRGEYLGWADAPVSWPGRPAPLPDFDGDPGVAIRITGPSSGQTISGPETFNVSADNARGVSMRAYYATDPRDATTRAWHDIGSARRDGMNWVLTWNTITIPDQGQAEWGTVRVEAIVRDENGRATGNRDSRRYRVDNTTGNSPPAPPASSTPPPTYRETTGGLTNTWSDYATAGGVHGPTIDSNQSVQIACKIQGFQVADGNTWWYRIASSPWNGSYYASADAFYNNGERTGALHGTPFVDPAVPLCL
jgi:hypothetical protein